MISAQDWGVQKEEAQFKETEGEIGEEDIDFDAVWVEEVEDIPNIEKKGVKEEESEFLSPLPVIRASPNDFHFQREEDIDFDQD